MVQNGHEVTLCVSKRQAIRRATGEIMDGFVKHGPAQVTNGPSHLHKKGLVRRLLPTMVGQRRTPQRYRAVHIPAGEAK